MQALQLDRELAVNTLFRAKYALNRTTHAAAQQLIPHKLADGIYAIDPDKAWEAALTYLQTNLQLDETNSPLPGSFLKSTVDILVFEVINEDQVFPYRYLHPDFQFDVTLTRPGVVMVIRVEYPRTYRLLGPITWQIRGASELVL